MKNRGIPSALTCGLSLTLVLACSKEEPVPPPQAPAVEIEIVTAQAVSTTFEFVARTRATEDAEIRARITGTILERNFEQGQAIAKDALLFKIDPRPYRATLNSARAQLSQADASIAVAERNLARGEELLPNGYISAAEMDKLRSERDSALASKDAAIAAVERAEIDIGFTEIRAPFAGTAGRSELSIGDLVDPSAGPLVTLVQLDPMLVDFEVDEQSLARRMQENQDRQMQELEPIPFTPSLRLVTGDLYPQTGEFDYTNNRVNPSTGTVTVTVHFPNPNGILIPGQFARIEIQRGDSELRLLIPQPSVLEDMQGSYVFIVSGDDTVERRNISLGQRDGVNWVVDEGLEEGDRLIVNGVQKVRPGMAVIATPVSTTPVN